MKTIIRNAFIIALTVLFASSCEKDSAKGPEYLSLAPYNLEGIWQLQELNGIDYSDEPIAYIELTRQDTKFTSYNKFETGFTKVRTGWYDIYTEEDAIWGIFDNSLYEHWSHKYIVSELTSGRMVWTASDDENLVRVYVRVDAVPEDFLSE